MKNLDCFVDAVCEEFHKSEGNLEKDQQLPQRDIVLEICQTLFIVSCLREEGRYPSFRVCFISPDAEVIKAYVYAHVCLFENPLEFDMGQLNKLAPALNGDISYLMVDVTQRPFMISGILTSHTMLRDRAVLSKASGNRMPAKR